MNVKVKAIASSTAFGFMAAALVLVLVAAVACFNAAPSECVEAAEEAGLPDEVIEQLRNPGDLNAIERAALNRILSQAGIDDVCEVASDAADSEDVPNIPRPSDSSASGDDKEDEPEERKDGDEAIKQTIASQSSARIPEEDENRRRCRFWALNNLEPVVYAEFSKLNPDDMDDLDRILWRTVLTQSRGVGYYNNALAGGPDVPTLLPLSDIYCRDYWAEPVNRRNADLRNHDYEQICRLQLEGDIRQQYRRMAKAVSHSADADRDLAFLMPNQYVRILQWMDLTGDELLKSSDAPYRILREQSQHHYAYRGQVTQTVEGVKEYQRETSTELEMEWLGILSAAGLDQIWSDDHLCIRYFPQVF